MVYILRSGHLDHDYDDSIYTIGIIDAYKSLLINEQYYGQGYFELQAPATKANINLLLPGNYVVREEDVNNALKQRVCAIQDVTIRADADQGAMIIATGASLGNEILKKRVIKDRQFLTGSVKDAVIEMLNQAFRNLYAGVVGNTPERKIKYFNQPSIEPTEGTINTQVLGERIDEWIESICRTYGWGWKVYLNGANYQFHIYKGADRTNSQSWFIPSPNIVFSREYDNLYNSEYSRYTSNYTNCAYIYGEDTDDGTKRKNTKYDPDSVADILRYERFVDSSMSQTEGEVTISDAQYYLNLQNLAKQEMAQVKLYDFTAVTDPDGMFKLNEDYFLGDIVKVVTEYGITAKARITEIIYSEDEQGKSVVPGFEEWEVI